MTQPSRTPTLRTSPTLLHPLLLSLSLAAALTACGGGDGFNTAQSPGGDQTTTPSTPTGPTPTTPTISIDAATRVVANTVYTSSASLSSGTATGITWDWGDGSAAGTTNPATHVWSRAGSFISRLSAVVNGSTLAGTQTTVVVGAPVSVKALRSCALKPDRTVACWGNNYHGGLGDGTSANNSATPVAVAGLTGVMALAVGNGHSCALKTGGSVACWGWGNVGQLGNGTTTVDQTSTVAVSGLTDAVALDANSNHTCAVKSDGTVACWGSNSGGELGDGTTTARSTPVTVTGLSSVTAIALGSTHSCALKSDGTVACWGSSLYGRLGNGVTASQIFSSPVAVSGLSDAIALAAGDAHTCALKSDGSVACWGFNTNGELGNGTTTRSGTPVAVSGLANAIALASGYSHTCALKADNTLACWGYNPSGQVGNGSTVNQTSPVAVAGLSGVAAVGTGQDHSCALKKDGSVLCWGGNGSGQIGDGSTTTRSAPTAAQGGSAYWQ